MTTIRALEPDEWRLFRAFWLEGRRNFPVFFSGCDETLTAPRDFWQSTLAGPAHQIFGLFDGALLIGITAAFARREDPAGETAVFGMSFILPQYRERGLSRLFYEARLEWTRARPNFKRVILSHAVSNDASRRAHRRYGFVLTGTAPLTGPDGHTEAEEFYEIVL